MISAEIEKVKSPRIEVPSPKLTSVSLFTGGGGLDLGLEAAGFATTFASDIDAHSCLTLEKGKARAVELGKPFLQHAVIAPPVDIHDISETDVFRATGAVAGEIDLLSGGPPCQAFSVFGRRQGRNDPRGELAFEYLRLLGGLQPKAFIFENVAGLLSIDGGSIFKELCKQLANPVRGLVYTISFFRLDAAYYHVPQFRDRIFLIGHKGGWKIPDIPRLSRPKGQVSKDGKLPLPLDASLPEWRTVRDALRGLPPAGSCYPPNHVGRVHSERIIERYRDLKAGERDHFTRINKLDLDRPSFTIIVGSDKGGGKGHVHPVEPREVTPRESARIQTFPDWWEFSGTSRHPIRQVGNAVPPLLAAALGNEIRHHIFGQERVPVLDIVSLLDQQHLFAAELGE